VDNILSVLKLTDRVCKIDLDGVTKSNMEEITRVMQQPFPELMDLRLERGIHPNTLNTAPSLPDSFLGGSASRLRSLILGLIPFPAIPKLLLSTTNLVTLHLGITNTPYILPEEMVTYLSVLTRLRSLSLRRRSYPPFHLICRPPPHSPLTVLHALTDFEYVGVNMYLGDLLARIDIPQHQEDNT